ncbi:NB-ARC domain-containing protein [Streptomyces sp. NPDC001982]|uniref:ATP-binding protein n=1 Tax=Streptomyces sp. NPDC001982 TaxID=3154405 RepID=UPI00332306E2
MRRQQAIALIGVLSGLLSVLLAVAVNVATGGSLPAPFDTVAWLSWPAVGVLTVVVGWLAVWQQRLAAPGAGPGDNRGAAGRPAELPGAPSLTGRAQDLAAVDELLAQGCRVITLVGPPGVGKSSLALRIAHDRREGYPDGQLFAALRGAGTDPAAPEAVLARFLGAMGVAEDERRGTAEDLAARFRSELADRKVLLVLDDARDAAQVAPLLPGGSGCLAVVTSRRLIADLPQSAAQLLGGLDQDSGLALLAEVVGAQRVATAPGAAARIVAACGGLPLALRIAGGRLRARVSWQLDDFAAQLQDERQRLDALRLGDLAVRSSFDASYEELPAPDRLVFRRCGSHPGQVFGLGAAAALAGREPSVVAAALERLVDMQLVESPTPGRYRLHDLLRLFATERTNTEDTPHERSTSLTGLLDWLTAHAAPGDWLAAERENVLAAMNRAVPRGLYEPAWTLAAAVGPLLSRAEDHVDRLALWRAAAKAATTLDDDGRRARARLQVSYAYRNSGEVTLALDSAAQAVAATERIGDQATLAEALMCHGEALRDLYRFDEAADALTRAVGLFAALGDEGQEIRARTALGTLYLQFWRADQAVEVLEPAVALLPPQDGPGHAWPMSALSGAYRLTGRREEAIALNERALRIARRGEEDSFAVGYLLQGRAWLAHEDGRPDDALKDMREMLAVFERIRHGTGVGIALEGIAEIATAVRRYDDAIEASAAAAVQFDRTGDRVRAGRSRLQQAVALAEAGHAEAAAAAWRTAEDLIGDTEPPEVPRLRDRLRELLGHQSPPAPEPA